MEILKYEVRLFTISFSKNSVQLRRKEQSALENRLKILESNLNSNKTLEEYNKCKNILEEIYGNIAEGVKVRSKILWYEDGEKSSKFFKNLEKTKAIQGIIKKLEIENKEISDPNQLNNGINGFFKKFIRKDFAKVTTSS